MSAASTADRDAILKDIASKLPVRPNARKRMIWMACMAIGLLSFAFLLFTQPQRAWGSYAINTIYWLGISLGAVVLACAIRLGNGRWGGPIIRIAESLSSFLPWGIGLKYFWSEGVALRIELVDNLMLGTHELSTMNNISLALGTEFRYSGFHWGKPSTH